MDEQQEQNIVSSASDAAERRLWLDYIARLNDRRLRTTGSSGATSWALLLALIAVLYKTVPQLPVFLADANNLKNCIVFLVLEFDAAFFFIASYAYLLSFYQGGSPAISLSEQFKRLRWITVFAVLIVQIVLVIGHLMAARILPARSNRITWLLLFMGVFWAANCCLLAIREMRRIRTARRYGVPVPLFAGSQGKLGALMLSATNLIIALACAFGLPWQLWHLRATGIHLLNPLGASCYALALVAILAGLVYRGFRSVETVSYDSLERAIVLESLSSPEIRARFVTQLVGSNSAEWLKEQTNILKEVDNSLQAVLDSTRKSLERLERDTDKSQQEIETYAASLLTKLANTMKSHMESVQRLSFLAKEFSQALHGEAATPLMLTRMHEWKAQLEQMAKTAAATKDLRIRLEKFARPGLSDQREGTLT
jgi:hypothetical protein